MLKLAVPALLAAISSVAAAASPGPVSYTVAPRMVDGAMTGLDVAISLKGDADGETRFALPDQWAGSSELWRTIGGLSVSGATIAEGDGPAHRTLRHRPGARITLRYTAMPAQGADPGFDYEKAKPLIRPDWFFFHGEGLFAVPLEREEAPVTFRWGKLPKGWKAASDLDHLQNRPGTIRDISESAGIGGADLSVITKDVDGAPLRLAMIGDWTFEAAALADTVQRIYAAENAYWGAQAHPFIVTVAPLGTVDGLSYTGTGRGDGFIIASTSALELGAETTRFLAHEINHRWMPAAIGRLPRENEGVDYWLSEGFNDYLTARILLRSGLWSLDQFADYTNEVLLRYAASPARTAPAEEVARNFWTNQAMQQISYDRGHLLAMLLDARLRAASGGGRDLDDVLRAQKEAAEGSSALASTLFIETLRDFGGIDAASDIARFTQAGDAILLPENVFGDCARIVTATRKEFHRGYDAEATAQAGGIIGGVRLDGPAYAAGMRDGMRLIRREFGKLGDSAVEIGYRVETDGAERVIRYFPAGEKQFTFQRMELIPERKNECLQKLAGI